MAKKAQLNEVRPMLNDVNDGISTVEGVLDAVESGADKATEALEHGLEKVADVVPEVLDKSVHVAAETTRKGVRALGSPRTLIVVIGVSGVVVGATAGYVVYRWQKKRLVAKIEAEHDQRLEVEIEAMRKFYEKRSGKIKPKPFSSPEEAAKALLPKTNEDKLAEEAAQALNTYEGDQPPPGIVTSPEDDPREGTTSRVRYDKVKASPNAEAVGSVVQSIAEDMKAEPETKAEEISHNVFVQRAVLDSWDQEAEESSRHAESPYVISHDEFMENSFEHQQNSLTYYRGDDTLVDERDQPIDEVEAVVGMENLRLFGHGSRDSNIVYIRNERIELDFEVTQNRGKYGEEVLGFQHADFPNSRFRKGRRGDDG